MSKIQEQFEATYTISEIFRSVQGEGFWCGVQSVFIRLQGCPVGCQWCDTPQALGKGGKTMTVSEILHHVEGLRIGRNGHVVITGGEPTIWDLGELIRALGRVPYYVQLETAAPPDGKPLMYRPGWITVSPKAARGFEIPEAFRRLRQVDELKYVVDNDFDPKVVDEGLGSVPIYLMPEGLPPRPEMIAKTLEILELHPTWRFGPRMQGWIGIR